MSESRISTQKPATAARMYDYYLGGIHNFPADRQAAEQVIAKVPSARLMAQTNRAFLGRAVRYLTGAGIRQFLDIGSGIPTEGNVHEIAQDEAPDARVVYVDIDPVAVAEGLEILEHNPHATAIGGDLRNPRAILNHREIRGLLDFQQPIGVLLAAVLHFVPDDAQAYDVVGQLVAELPPGSYMAVSAGAVERFAPTDAQTKSLIDVYEENTTTSLGLRSKSQFERFFTGLELVDPGVVWVHEWPDPHAPSELAHDPSVGGQWAAVGRKR